MPDPPAPPDAPRPAVHVRYDPVPDMDGAIQVSVSVGHRAYVTKEVLVSAIDPRGYIEGHLRGMLDLELYGKARQRLSALKREVHRAVVDRVWWNGEAVLDLFNELEGLLRLPDPQEAPPQGPPQGQGQEAPDAVA